MSSNETPIQPIQTSYKTAAAGAFGTTFAALGATPFYTLSNMAASTSPLSHILRAVRHNPWLLFNSTPMVFGKLFLASGRFLAMPVAEKTVQNMSPLLQDLVIAALMSVAELPSAMAELFEIWRSSKATHREIAAQFGQRAADSARLLVPIHRLSTWALFFGCTMLKNGPLNWVAARNLRIANESAGETAQGDTQVSSNATKRVITATSQLFFSATVAGAALQGPLYRSARGYSPQELLWSILCRRNLLVGLCKGVAHIPIGLCAFGFAELARAYEHSHSTPVMH